MRAVYQLRSATVQRGRDLMVASAGRPGFRTLNKTAYGIMERIAARRLGAVPGVRAIYLGHGLAAGEFYAGLSDFDLFVALEPDSAGGTPEALAAEWRSLCRFLPVKDIITFASNELETWFQVGGGWEPRDEIRHWKRIWGEELRPSAWSLDDARSERDRLRFSLAGFQKLIGLALKEELRSPTFRIQARRQIYKAFCETVLPLDAWRLETPRQVDRLRRWADDHGSPAPAREMLRAHAAEFRTGPIVTLQREAVAFAYHFLTDRLTACSPTGVPAPPSYRVPPSLSPLGNEEEVRRRVEPFVDRLAQLLADSLHSVALHSTGSGRGYALAVILKDDLQPSEVEAVVARLRVAFRIYDDPWFNEHYAKGVPEVFSQEMFRWHQRLWPPVAAYGASHRCILFGADPYDSTPQSIAPPSTDELAGERASMARYVRSILMNESKPALFDAATLHLPRMRVLEETGTYATTAEEAVALYEQLPGASKLPAVWLEAYEEMDVDALLRSMKEEDVDSARRFIEAELLSRSA